MRKNQKGQTARAAGRIILTHDPISKRATELGEYIACTGATVREAAAKYNISKSTVHKDISERLRCISPGLYKRVRSVLELNKEERHLRGGMATKKKYRLMRELHKALPDLTKTGKYI